MIFDGHIHISNMEADPESFQRNLKVAGVDGGIVISYPPNSFLPSQAHASNSERLDSLQRCVEGNPNLYPFYWIDPMEEDAVRQIRPALKQGVKGFKVICNGFYPGDQRPVEVFYAIAKVGKPILFHSGILWSYAWSDFSRPVNFEPLFGISDLRFAMAHISWPWCDEMIALYGKYQWAKSNGISAELFIDTTPGTPTIYRREVLTKLFTIGYNVKDNVFFGSDNLAESYDPKNITEWMERDNAIYREIGLDDQTVGKFYSDNLLRFVLGSEAKTEPTTGLL